MNTETKRHIDAARQVLVGVVPNPTSQIDQITNALIYKFMDDMDQAAIKQGGEPSFFVGNLKDYAWTRLMDARVGNQERMNIYSEALVKFSESKQLPQLFREIFKSAFLPYRNPEVLGLFLKEISYFDYSHPEELGNAYEYLLSIMSSQGDAGQFRTPRHIIDFMVAVVDPKIEDKVLDPACGTGGFLVSAYNRIMAQHDGKNPDGTKNNEKPLTPDQRKNLMGNFEGYDIDPGMVRIAQVNMYLHRFNNPKIFNYDTLSMEERWGDKFSVILANPPFMSPKGGVSTHSKFSIQSTRSEVLFVDYIMNHLRPQGRAGIIVPEGIIFQSGKSHTQLRKNLVEDGLCAVVSLPSGVFNPYSGVKTSILLFDNEVAKKSKEILFVKITHDGTDLGAKKRTTVANDLPTATEVIQQFKEGHFKESKIAHAVSKQTVIDSGDYNLSGDRYKIATEVQSEFDLTELGELILEQSERAHEIDGTEVWSVSNRDGFVLSSEYFDKQVASADISNYKIIKPGYFAYNPSRINVGSLAFNNSSKTGAVSPMYVVFAIKENAGLSADYLFSLLKSEKLNEFILQLAQGAVRQQLRFNDLKIIKIPLPPLEIQEQIVSELDGYQNIISGAKQIAQNWKPKIDIDPEWEKVKLPDISKNNDNKRKPVTKSDRRTGKYPYYGASGIVDYVEEYIFDGKYLLVSEDGANLLARSTPIAFSISGKNWVNNHAHILEFENIFTQKYVETYVNQIDVSNFVTGMAQPKLNQQSLNTIEIPLPPLEIQKQIVERIESERTLVESTQKLIEIYEQKTKDTLAKLWNE
jgi:type I restriction enzyme M protein